MNTSDETRDSSAESDQAAQDAAQAPELPPPWAELADREGLSDQQRRMILAALHARVDAARDGDGQPLF